MISGVTPDDVWIFAEAPAFNEFRAAFRSGIVQGRPVAAALRIGSGSDKFIKELVLPLENGEHQRGFAELIEVVDIESAAL